MATSCIDLISKVLTTIIAASMAEAINLFASTNEHEDLIVKINLVSIYI